MMHTTITNSYSFGNHVTNPRKRIYFIGVTMNRIEWLKHLEPVVAALDAGLTVECAESLGSTEWTVCTGKNFNIDKVYRIKPQKRFCNRVELYPCLRTLNISPVFVADSTSPNGYARFTLEADYLQDFIGNLIAAGIVYSTKEAASHHGLAMRMTYEQ